MTGRVTISAIAEQAGVSVPTVSRVVNGRSDVAPDTRARIEGLLRLHGYRRRTRRPTDRARLLDLVFNDLDSPWAVEIIRGVEEIAHAAGVGTVLSAIHSRSSSVEQWMDNLRARASDGVILVSSELEPSMRAELKRLEVPLAVVDPAGAALADVPTIGTTNWAGGLSATEHLISLGHTRIGLVAGPPRLMCSRARLDGYRAAMETADLPVPDELIVSGDFYHESGFDAANALFDLDAPPTAVFASSDQMALGVAEALRQRGLNVPGDVSIVGFDDLPAVRWFAPPLTTVRQPLAEMGKLAARVILRQAAGEQIENLRMELRTELVVRASTAPPPAR